MPLKVGVRFELNSRVSRASHLSRHMMIAWLSWCCCSKKSPRRNWRSYQSFYVLYIYCIHQCSLLAINHAIVFNGPMRKCDCMIFREITSYPSTSQKKMSRSQGALQVASHFRAILLQLADGGSRKKTSTNASSNRACTRCITREPSWLPNMN